MITKKIKKTPVTASRINRPMRNITAGTSINATRRPITAGVKPVGSRSSIMLSPEKARFADQLMRNVRKANVSINAATNTSNIMARPDFMELLPMFVQKLLVLDVFGSVAMNSRQQLIPYFKFIAENTKGETHAGDVLSSPFVNRQGIDPNFTGRVVKNETIGSEDFSAMYMAYLPVLPGSVTIQAVDAGTVTQYVDDGQGNLLAADGSKAGIINYSDGSVTLDTTPAVAAGNLVRATYQYDNETVGPHLESPLAHGQYGASMGKGYLMLDEINLVAEAHQLASYWSIYSAFAASREYGANVGDISKEAAFSEITAEINANGFAALKNAAAFRPQYNWDAAPVVNGSVVPTDYINTFMLKLNQAAASIYQGTRLSQPNRLIVGTNVSSYLGMINGFAADTATDNVGPYHAGRVGQYEVYVDPNYDPNEWVMCCKSNDIRRNSALFGEYMPLMSTDAIGLANASVQQGYATMYAMKVVNPATVVRGQIVGTY